MKSNFKCSSTSFPFIKIGQQATNVALVVTAVLESPNVVRSSLLVIRKDGIDFVGRMSQVP